MVKGWIERNMRNFRDLNIWVKGIEIAKEVYTLARKLPEYERYGMFAQIARSAVSVSSNIAEGSGKSSNKDFKRYLEIALGSLYELETHLVLINQIHGLEIDLLLNNIQEEQKMVAAFIQKL